MGLRRGLRRAGRAASSASSTRRWWRVKVEGAERVPAHGRALLTANHAGILPWDATMISMALLREHPLPRYPRFLVLNWAFDLPWVSGGDAEGRRRGGLALQRDAAARAGPARGRLPRGREGHGQAVLASATGSSASAAAASWRSRSARARRSCRWRSWAARRSTRSSPTCPPLARLIGAPYFPVTPTFPLARPARRRAAAVEVADRVPRADRDRRRTAPRAAEDRALVFELSERVRERDPAGAVREPRKRGPAFI